MACGYQEDGAGASSGCCRVNRKLLPVKGFFFAFFAAIGSLLPFIAVYMKHLGLTSDETGVIYGVMPFLSFVVRPLVGGLADRWLKHKLLLIVCTLLTAVFHFVIMFVPARSTISTVHVQPLTLHCGPARSTMSSCSSSFGEGVNDVHFEDFRNDHDFRCSVPLEEFVKSIGDSEMFDVGERFINKTVDNGEISPSNHTENMSFNRSLEMTQHGVCSVTCYLTNRGSTTIVQNSETTSFCFTNQKGHFNNQCQRLQTDDQTLTFNITNALHLFRKRQTVFHNEILQTNGCQQTYPLGDVEAHGEKYKHLVCSDVKSAACHMKCVDVPVSKVCETSAVQFDLTFGLLFVIEFFACAAFSPVFSLADDIVFDQLEGEHHKYGQQRMWATLGLAIFAITTTFAMNPGRDDISHDDVNYDVMFYLFTSLCVVSALIATALKVSTRVRCQKLLKNACQLLTLPEVIAFLGVVMYLGMVSGAIEGFLFWYLADLGAEPLLFGLCLVINSAFEIPLFFFSGAIIKRLKPVTCLYSSMLVLSVRLLSYSFLSNPWYVLFVEALHGVTFGLMWAAVANHANAISPPGMSASVQGLVGGMNFGVGRGVGSLLTGMLFSSIGERWTFRALAAACLVLLTIYSLLNSYVFPKHTTPQTRSLDVDTEGKNDEASQKEEFLRHKTNDVI